MTADTYIAGILSGNRSVLARAITLVESNAPHHAPVAAEVIQGILAHSGKSLRVGITGVPGVGKSTFIENLGMKLCQQGHRLAVLTVDPSSPLTHGSILGDKTRMERLCREPHTFIRPSPTSGNLGGVARKSRETILLCEAAGYDIIFVETVGVGQSETTVRSMVDFFLVLLLAGAGDDLQGIKKGIIELADALVFTKADGPNRLAAETACAELTNVLHYLRPPHPHWRPPVLLCSSLEDTGIDAIWEIIRLFQEKGQANGFLLHQRQTQTLHWMQEMLRQELWLSFSQHPHVHASWDKLSKLVLSGHLSPTQAVTQFLTLYHHYDSKN